MALANVGCALHEATASAMLAGIRRAEQANVPAVWLTTGAGPDALTVFAAAAACTSRIRMGTAIVPTFPRHPVVVAQQCVDIDNMAPDRFTLGVGPSHAPAMEGRYGLPYVRPLEHVREFVTVVKSLVRGEEIDFRGKRYKAAGRLNHPGNVPVIISALRSGSFELAGEIADGAVTWLCPAPYLRDVALPAMDKGAAASGRKRPKLVAHAFLALETDAARLKTAVDTSLLHYPRLKNYQEMFAAAGLPEARQGLWSPGMIDAVVLSGDEAACDRRVREFIERSGCDELILSVLVTGTDRAVSLGRTLEFIGRL